MNEGIAGAVSPTVGILTGRVLCVARRRRRHCGAVTPTAEAWSGRNLGRQVQIAGAVSSTAEAWSGRSPEVSEKKQFAGAAAPTAEAWSGRYLGRR